jgi:hypothetical protein
MKEEQLKRLIISKQKNASVINEEGSAGVMSGTNTQSVLGSPDSPSYGGFIGPLSRVVKRKLNTRILWKGGKVVEPPQGYVHEHLYSYGGKMITEGDLQEWFKDDLNKKPSWNGGKIVQIEPKCSAFPYCSQGAIDKPIKLIGETKEEMCDDCYNYCKTIGEEIQKTPEQVAKLIREFAVKEFEKLDEYYEKNSTIQLEENNKIKDKKNIKEMKIKLRANIATIKRQMTEMMNDSNLSGCLHEVLMSEGFITENDDLVEGASTLMQDNDIVLEMFNTCLKNQTECGKTLREALKMKMIKRKHSPRLGDDSETLLENDLENNLFRDEILDVNGANEIKNSYENYISILMEKNLRPGNQYDVELLINSFNNILKKYLSKVQIFIKNPNLLNNFMIYSEKYGVTDEHINELRNSKDMLNTILTTPQLNNTLFNKGFLTFFQNELENKGIDSDFVSIMNDTILFKLRDVIYSINKEHNKLSYESELYRAVLENNINKINKITSGGKNKISYFDLDPYVRNSNTGEDDDDQLDESEIKGKNVDNENKKNSKKDTDEMLKQSTDTQKTTQEKVENLKNQKYQLGDKKTTIKNTALGFRNNLDLDYNSELSKDQKDKIKDEVKGVAPKDHANVDIDSKGGEELLNNAENRRKEESIHDEDWTSIPTKTDVTNNPNKEKDNLFKEEVMRMNNLIDYDKIRLKKIKGK